MRFLLDSKKCPHARSKKKEWKKKERIHQIEQPWWTSPYAVTGLQPLQADREDLNEI